MEKNDVFWTQPQTVFIGNGSTLGQLFEPQAAQNSWVIKAFSGGSLAFVGVSLGMTLSAAQLVAAGNSGYYQFASGEALPIAGPARFYLLAQGATAIVNLIRGYGPS